MIADRVNLETSLGFVALHTRRFDPIVMLTFDAIARIWTAINSSGHVNDVDEIFRSKT